MFYHKAKNQMKVVIICLAFVGMVATQRLFSPSSSRDTDDSKESPKKINNTTGMDNMFAPEIEGEDQGVLQTEQSQPIFATYYSEAIILTPDEQKEEVLAANLAQDYCNYRGLNTCSWLLRKYRFFKSNEGGCYRWIACDTEGSDTYEKCIDACYQ